MVPEEVFIVGLCGLPPAFGHRAPDEFMRGKNIAMYYAETA